MQYMAHLEEYPAYLHSRHPVIFKHIGNQHLYAPHMYGHEGK